jgi:ABC-type antimicrobial peptide transport system permease subunit
MIDETLARRYWPGEDPLGQHINFGGDSPWMTIVGLVAHAKSSSLESDTTEGFYYLAMAQQPQPTAGVMVQARGSSPEGFAAAMQSAIRRVDPSQPLYDLKTMEQRIDASLISRRFLVVLLSVFAGIALLLAALGLYGVISYTVALRTREMGIRMALGAGRGDVLRLIVIKGMQLALVGLGVGLLTTFIAGRALSSLLYQVSLFNPLTLLATSALLLLTVFLASYVPARWAARLDPVVALRDE